MNSIAVRAEAQSANNKHMVFNSEEHEKFLVDKELIENEVITLFFITEAL